MKELEEEWAKLDTTPPKPTRLTRSQQEKQAQAPPVEAAAAAAESVEEGNSSFIASFNLKNISKGFYSLFMSRLTVEIFILKRMSCPSSWMNCWAHYLSRWRRKWDKPQRIIRNRRWLYTMLDLSRNQTLKTCP